MSEPTKRYPSGILFNDDGSPKLVTATEWLREEAAVYLGMVEDEDDSVPDAPERVIGMSGIADEIDDLRTALTLATQRAEAAEAEVTAIIDVLGLTRDDEDSPWWLAGDPSPVECDTVAEAVRELIKMCEHDVKRAEAERDALRNQLQEIHEREAECCGEDESFDERILSLTSERDALRTKLARYKRKTRRLYAMLKGELQGLRRDYARLNWLSDSAQLEAIGIDDVGEAGGCVGLDMYEHASIVADERGNEGDLTDTDLRRGFRRMIDAAMAVQPTPTGDTP